MNSAQSVVTILVPVYGVERYIEECVRSLMEQSYKECRYIFVDDCSPDSSINILKAVVEDYPHRKDDVKIVSHPYNKGLAEARNTLFESVTEGEYVICVDSDDWVEPNFVESLVVRAVATQADAVRCGRVEVNQSGVGRAERLLWLSSPYQTCRAILGQSHWVACNIHGVMIRRDFVEKHNIHAVAGIDMAEDYLLTSQITFHAERIASVNEPLYCYRELREGSFMNAMNAQRNTESYVRANFWVTQYIESQSEGERYHRDLAAAKVNIKKWIAKRGLPPKMYDTELFGARREEWLRSLSLRVYNMVVDLDIILLTQFVAAVISLPLILRVAWHKFRVKRAQQEQQMWGR